MEQLQSQIWLTASSFMGKYLRVSSYIRKPFLIHHFATAPFWISLYRGNFDYLFYQCVVTSANIDRKLRVKAQNNDFWFLGRPVRSRCCSRRWGSPRWRGRGWGGRGWRSPWWAWTGSIRHGSCSTHIFYTHKKVHQILLIEKEIQSGAVAKSYIWGRDS